MNLRSLQDFTSKKEVEVTDVERKESQNKKDKGLTVAYIEKLERENAEKIQY